MQKPPKLVSPASVLKRAHPPLGGPTAPPELIPLSQLSVGWASSGYWLHGGGDCVLSVTGNALQQVPGLWLQGLPCWLLWWSIRKATVIWCVPLSLMNSWSGSPGSTENCTS